MGRCSQRKRCLQKQIGREGLQDEQQGGRHGRLVRGNATSGVGETPLCRGGGDWGKNIMLIDIGKAHLYAPVEGEVYVDLPPERSEIGKCARLLYTLYGMKTAASSWEKEYGNTLKDAGFVIGRANTCAFWHPERGVYRCARRCGFENDLKYVENVFRKKYPVKMRATLRPDPNDHKEADILNREVQVRCREGELPRSRHQVHREGVVQEDVQAEFERLQGSEETVSLSSRTTAVTPKGNAGERTSRDPGRLRGLRLDWVP